MTHYVLNVVGAVVFVAFVVCPIVVLLAGFYFHLKLNYFRGWRSKYPER